MFGSTKNAKNTRFDFQCLYYLDGQKYIYTRKTGGEKKAGKRFCTNCGHTKEEFFVGHADVRVLLRSEAGQTNTETNPPLR